MSEIANRLIFYLLNSAWQMPVLAAITALMLRMMSKSGAKLRYRVWVSCLLLAVTLPALSASLGMKILGVHPSYKQTNTADRLTTRRRSDDGPLTLRFTEVAAPSSKHGLGMVLPGL